MCGLIPPHFFFNKHLLSRYCLLLILWHASFGNSSLHAQSTDTEAILSKSFSTQDFKKDLEVYKEVLAQIHPNLYRFISRRTLNQYYQEAEYALENAETLDDFYHLLLPLTQALNCRATRLALPSAAGVDDDADQNLFPLPLKIIGNKLYVDAVGLEVPLGTEIVSINQHSDASMIKTFSALSSFQPQKKRIIAPLIERRFAQLFQISYPKENSFVIRYRSPHHEKVLQKRVPGISKAVLKTRIEDRYSASSPPKLTLIDSLKTAIFPIQVMDDLSREKRIIQTRRFIHKLRRKQVEHLVLDLRSSKNLPSEYYQTLLAHLSYSHIDPFDSVWVKSLRVPMPQYIRTKDKKMIPRIERWLLRNFEARGRSLYLLKASKTPHIVPNKERFEGSLYVLIDQHSSQSNGFLAAVLRNQDNATFIGEETLAEYYAHMGGVALSYRLPHTHLELSIPLVYYKYHINNHLFPPGSGIAPHYEQLLDAQSFLRQQDPVLDFTLKLVKLGQVR